MQREPGGNAGTVAGHCTAVFERPDRSDRLPDRTQPTLPDPRRPPCASQ